MSNLFRGAVVLMQQIVGFQDIVGLAGGQYGPSEVAGQENSTVLLAKELPKSVAGIPVTAVDVGDTEEIHIDVQREFRPDRLMLVNLGSGADGEESDLFQVQSFSIGDTNLNASPNPVPLAAFDPAAVGTSIRAPRTTDPSLGIDMVVTNANTDPEAGPVWGLAGQVTGPSARPGAGAGAGGRVAGIVGAANDDAADPGAASNDDAKNLPQSFIGIPYTAGPALATQRVTIKCQVFRDIRPDRLLVGNATSAQWMIRDIRVGTTSLNASTNPLPARCYTLLSFGNRLRATVTSTPSVGINIDAFSNEAGSVAPFFCGGIFGPSRFPTT